MIKRFNKTINKTTLRYSRILRQVKANWYTEEKKYFRNFNGNFIQF